LAALENQSIVFFDGVCNLCNKAVDFLLRFDRSGKLKFAPLQGTTATKVLKQVNFESIVFYHEGKELKKSEAAFALLRFMDFPWRILLVLRIFPTYVCDAIYDFIAKYRYQIFGKSDSCRLPTIEESARFLD